MRRLLLVGLGLSACSMPATSPPATTVTPLGDVQFHQRTLANGLHAIAIPDAGETVSVFMVVGAGNRHETAGTTGLAHLTEHALYTGTPDVPAGEHDRRIHAMGGQSNAFTRQDYTLYYDHELPVERLAEVLTMEADRLRNIVFDEDAVLYERGRLIDEEARTFQSSMARDELLESVVFQQHPYRHGLLDENGHTTAGRLDVPVIRAFYEAFYHPDHVAVVVAGAIEPDPALDAIDAAFGSLPPGPPRPAIAPEPDATARTESLASDLPRERRELVWIGPAMGDPDRPTLDVIARLLSRRTLLDDSPVSASMGERVDRDLFRVAGTGPASTELNDLVAELRERQVQVGLLEEVKALAATRFTDLSIRGRPYFSLAGIYGLHVMLGHPEVVTGYADAIEEITPASLQEVARRHLDPARAVTVVFRAGGAAEPLPDDPKELADEAQKAAEAGDLDRAIAAYTKLLDNKPDRMFTVIYLTSRGQVRMDQGDLDGAIADFEEALSVVDYPAVRDLLREAQARKAGEDG